MKYCLLDDNLMSGNQYSLQD